MADQRRRVSKSFLVGEGVRNVVSSRFVTAVLALTCLAASVATAIFVTTETSEIEGRWAEGIAAGRFVWTVPERVPGLVTAERCDALNGVEGIKAAGSVVRTDKVSPDNSPGTRYSLDSVTVHYLDVLWPDQPNLARSGGLVSGGDAASQLGLRDGVSAAFTTLGGDARWRAVIGAVALNPSARDDAASGHLYQVVPPRGPVATCLVDAEPGADRAVQQLLLSWFPQDGEPVVRPFLETSSVIGQPPEIEYRQRVSRWAWTLGLGVMAIAMLGVWYARREELALYQLLGLRRRHVLVVLMTELVVSMLLPTQVGFALAELIFRQSLDSAVVRQELVNSDLRLVAGLVLIPALTLLLLRPTRLLDRLKGE